MSSQRCRSLCPPLVCVLITMACGRVFSAAPSTEPVRSKLLEPKTTKDEKSGLQMNLPKGWIARTDIEDTGFEAPVKDQAKGSTLAPNVILKAANIEGVKPTDVDQILKTKRKQYAQIFKGFKEVDPTPPAKTIPGNGLVAVALAPKIEEIPTTETAPGSFFCLHLISPR
jgi:hypothetical protein